MAHSLVLSVSKKQRRTQPWTVVSCRTACKKMVWKIVGSTVWTEHIETDPGSTFKDHQIACTGRTYPNRNNFVPKATAPFSPQSLTLFFLSPSLCLFLANFVTTSTQLESIRDPSPTHTAGPFCGRWMFDGSRWFSNAFQAPRVLVLCVCVRVCLCSVNLYHVTEQTSRNA